MIRQRSLPPAALALLILSLPVAAQERVGVRGGDHPGHGRIVFDWSRPVEYWVAERDGRVLLRFAEPATLDGAALARPPRNIRAVAGQRNEVEITLAPGARPRHFRLGNRIVIDVADPGVDPPASAVSAAAVPVPGVVPRQAPAPQAQRPAPVALNTVPSPAVMPPSVPSPAAEAPLPPIATGPAVRLALGPILVLPSPAGTGAALLWRGDAWLVELEAPLYDRVGFNDYYAIEKSYAR